jgi:hypothetical protein
MIMAEETDTPAINWKALARDLGIAILLVVVTFELFGQARANAPAFQPADIHVVEAPIAGFTTVRVWEHGPAPPRAPTIRSRSALLLEGYPPNLPWYVPGWSMDMEARFTVGSTIRLEVAEDPEAQAAHARAWPESEFLMAIVGMQYGDEVFFQAIDSIQRREAYARTYRLLGVAAGIAALAWGSWLLWSWRQPLRALLALVRE